MAKGKSVAYVWICQDTKMINGSGRARKENVKNLTKMKYSPKVMKRTEHKAKLVKKGGTKALKNAK